MNEFKDRALKVGAKYQSRIKEALKPVKELFGVNYFYYSSVSNAGMYTSFSSNPEWNRWWFDNELHQESFYFLQPQNYRFGITVSLPSLEEEFKKVREIAADKFNIRYVLEVVSKNYRGMESFGFSSETLDHAILTQFLTDLPCLKLFFRQFRERNEDLFAQLENNQVNIAHEIGPDFFKGSAIAAKPSIGCDFLKNLGVPIVADLSQREREICRVITKGLSAGEIAEDLDLSKRTIESYIENIKVKLNCFAKAELVQKCLDLESVGYFELV